MKKTIVFLTIVVCLSCSTSDDNFGSNLKIISSFPLNFNNDNIVDSLILMRRTTESKLNKNCIQHHLYKKTKEYTSGDQIIMGFKLSKDHEAKRYSKYIVYDSSFFSTPIWQTKGLPVEVISHDSISFKRISGKDISIKNDVVVLGTEAGIDIYLYWKNDKFELYEPIVEP